MALSDAQKSAITLIVGSIGALPGVNRAQFRAGLTALIEDLDSGAGGDGTVRFVNHIGPNDDDAPTFPGNVPLTASDIPCNDPAP